MSKVVVAERTKKALGRKMANGKGGQRDNGGGQMATKGPDKGKRKEGGTGKDRLGEK
jgi:hypothetical protein